MMTNRLLLTALLIGLLPAAAAATPGWFKKSTAPALLPADQAFVLEPVIWREGEIEIPVRVLPGHYLYRHRFEVEGIDNGLQLPPGEHHEDEFFGVVEIYRQDVTVRLPANPPPSTLTVRYQGCADAGVCYPVQTRTVTIEVLP